jgi:ParB-like chromosome segregation protein Spo0J
MTGITLSDHSHFEWVAVDHLTPHPRNPRDNEPGVDAVADSIRRFGFNAPIITDGDLRILAGHTRLLAARKLGMISVPVVRITHLSPSEAMGYMIADNQTASLTTWRDLDLAQLLAELDSGAPDVVAALGFSDKALADLRALAEDAERAAAEALANVPSGGAPEFEQMEFVLSHDQAETLRKALQSAAAQLPLAEEPPRTKNTSANALLHVVSCYLADEPSS